MNTVTQTRNPFLSDGIMQVGLPDGSTVYSRFPLSAYDFPVHCFSNPVIWCCPTSALVRLCRNNVRKNHLEIGIASGRLFRRSVGQRNFSRLVIADVNQRCLQYASHTLEKFQPDVWNFNILDILKDRDEIDWLQQMQRFESIGINYVLHCLPCSFAEKVSVIHQLVDHLLVPDGVLFGSALFPELNENWMSKKLMDFYNRKRIFNNKDDRFQEFLVKLEELNFHCKTEIHGCVGMFAISQNQTEHQPGFIAC